MSRLFEVRKGWLVLGLLAAGCGGGGGGPTVQVTVSGTARYEDRVYNQNGFTTQRPQLPIRFATVQLVNEDDDVLGSSRTDGAGNYSLTAGAEEGSSIRVAVVAETTGTYNAQVTNGSQVYARSSPSFTAAAGARTQDVVATVGELGGAFNILANVIRGADLVLALRPGATFVRLNLVWPNNGSACPNTSCFLGSTNTLYLVSRSGDTDEYDDDIILHEFGHYVAHNFSFDTSRGGAHNPFDTNPEPPALAWSEGFAHWISSEARGNSGQVDTFGDSDNSFFELESPSAASITVGAGNEIAVGAILWDITDPANERHDSMANQRAPLWDVIGTLFPSTRPADVTLDAFCDGWFTRGHGQAGPLSSVFAHRSVACP